MTVIIPHQDIELKLRNLQKKVISSINTNCNNVIFYEVIPLWIPLPEQFTFKTKSQLKTFSTSIISVTLKDFIYKQNTIFIEGSILCNKNKEENKQKTDLPVLLPLAKLYKESSNKDFTISKDLLKKINLEAYMPLSIKIFRLGITTAPTNNSIAISDFVWVKIH